MSDTQNSEWIEHDGTRLPVDVDDNVVLLFRDGDTRAGRAGFWHGEGSASESNWIWDESDPLDIVAFRMVKP